jgi:hypothetical protein
VRADLADDTAAVGAEDEDRRSCPLRKNRVLPPAAILEPAAPLSFRRSS